MDEWQCDGCGEVFDESDLREHAERWVCDDCFHLDNTSSSPPDDGWSGSGSPSQDSDYEDAGEYLTNHDAAFGTACCVGSTCNKCSVVDSWVITAAYNEG